ncbi:hypothetical protein [Absidia glauca]|uniref:Uncharacterized protein n=1 Tax=Absidia glauca TaxID=4829 RepID=A0A163J2H3_ABSGL|nr:hypothetical protein [Absidia glauca]
MIQDRVASLLDMTKVSLLFGKTKYTYDCGDNLSVYNTAKIDFFACYSGLVISYKGHPDDALHNLSLKGTASQSSTIDHTLLADFQLSSILSVQRLWMRNYLGPLSNNPC